MKEHEAGAPFRGQLKASDEEAPARRISISAPYPEGAIGNLAVVANEQRQLDKLYLPSRKPTRMAARTLSTIPTKRTASLSRRLARGANLLDLPSEEVAPSIELKRLLSKLRWAPASWQMEELKPQYDSAVARRVRQQGIGNSSAFVGMPSACLATFGALPSGVLRVFHEVDAPPHAHNRELLRHYSRAEAGPELLSPHTMDRIESEIRESDALLSPSSIVSRQLLEVSPEASIIQIPYGVQFSSFAPTNLAQRGKAGLHVLYVGQISYRKGLPFLLEAARRFRGTIELVGPVVREEILARLPSNVRYHGVLAPAELRDRFANADAFVFPSVEDNFGLAVVEALCAGLPIITTSAVGAAEVIPAADIDIVPAGDSMMLAEALARVSPLSPDARRDRATRARVAGPISWQSYGERVTAAITSRLR